MSDFMNRAFAVEGTDATVRVRGWRSRAAKKEVVEQRNRTCDVQDPVARPHDCHARRR